MKQTAWFLSVAVLTTGCQRHEAPASPPPKPVASVTVKAVPSVPDGPAVTPTLPAGFAFTAGRWLTWATDDGATKAAATPECISPEEAKLAGGSFFPVLIGARECRWMKFDMMNGKLDAAYSCGGDYPRNAKVQGSYSPRQVDLVVTGSIGARYTYNGNYDGVCSGTENKG